MYHWYHSHEHIELNSPSRADGVDFDNETRYRKEGARFIMELGNKLGLRYLPIATGIVFFHRFYMFHSFKEFPRWVTGATCLLLAGKVEETPKKCKDILKYAQQLLDDNKFKAFGENPREEVMVCERILLQTIKFDLQLNHPYQFLIKYGKVLKGDKDRINELVQKAWIFINDSLSTTLCLIYKPQVVALAVLLLAVKISNQNIRDFISSKSHHEWWKLFYADANEEELEEICKELTLMYEGKTPKRRFPNSTADKKKATDSVTNSPQATGSPKPKKPKVSASTPTSTSSSTSSNILSIVSSIATAVASTTTTTVAISADNAKPIAAVMSDTPKKDSDTKQVSVTEVTKVTSTTIEVTDSSLSDKKTPLKDISMKQGSQTPEEMDVEKTPDDSPVERSNEREVHLQEDNSVHQRDVVKSKDQPVTLQQVQAEHQKLLQRQTQKQQVQKQSLSQQKGSQQPLTPPPLKISTASTKSVSQKEVAVSSPKVLATSPAPSHPTPTQKKQAEDSPRKQSLLPMQVPLSPLTPQTKAVVPQIQESSVTQQQTQGQQLVKQPLIHHQQAKSQQQQQPASMNQQPQQQAHQLQQSINASDSSIPQQSTHASTTTNVAESSQSAAPILDHMSSFFQSNQAYNYPSQSYTHPQSYPAPPPFPQPTLPQGIPQPPQGFAQHTHQNYMGANQQMNPYLDNNSQQTYNYSSSQPPMMMQPQSGHHPMPPPPSMFHGTPWM